MIKFFKRKNVEPVIDNREKYVVAILKEDGTYIKKVTGSGMYGSFRTFNKWTLMIYEDGERLVKVESTVNGKDSAKAIDTEFYWKIIHPWLEHDEDFSDQIPTIDQIKNGAKPFRNYHERIPEYPKQ